MYALRPTLGTFLYLHTVGLYHNFLFLASSCKSPAILLATSPPSHNVAPASGALFRRWALRLVTNHVV